MNNDNVIPFSKYQSQENPKYKSVDDMIKSLKPTLPVLCIHPENLKSNAETFVEGFPGKTFYAVKSNPDDYVLKHLYNAGIKHFDVASLVEIQQVRELFPDAHLAFMNPVKSREAIKQSYFDYGVRDFVVDTQTELTKVLEETQNATDLTIFVRLAMPKGSAACTLAGKFGANQELTIELLETIMKLPCRVGLSFHVGSQTLDPNSYILALQKAETVIEKSGAILDVLDIGGGFPIAELGMDILPLKEYFDVIKAEIDTMNLPESCEIWCEPGRALSGTGEVLVVRVELRKGDTLYINDGSYGNMFEVCSMNWKNQVSHVRAEGTKSRRKNKAFHFYGPTCDSIDYMEGPFMLPNDISEGDWIAISGMGSYVSASKSAFNGFGKTVRAEINPSYRRRYQPEVRRHIAAKKKPK